MPQIVIAEAREQALSLLAGFSLGADFHVTHTRSPSQRHDFMLP
jgi:hypothetical protein